MNLTIVMYHYVRRIQNSRYPEIKGLEREHFIEQLKYLKRFYTPISGQQAIDAINGREELPDNPVLLTFDDGYLDHFTTAFPILMEEDVPGVFFPPAKCVLERDMLDVNKIHYILASVPDKSMLADSIDTQINLSRHEFELETIANYRAKFAIPNRFDTAEVIYIKRMLQVALPESLRTKIADRLFEMFVSSDQKSFANEIYMDESQAKCMVQAGMTMGSHGYNHYWLNSLTPEEQTQEVDLSIDFLNRIGQNTKEWMMCYPYGAWNESLLSILKQRGCSAGFTTQVDVAHLNKNDPLLLPRLDTNDLPKLANASPNEWTIKTLNA